MDPQSVRVLAAELGIGLAGFSSIAAARIGGISRVFATTNIYVSDN
jgi:hypothetical protein